MQGTSSFRTSINVGLLAGVAIVYLALVGILQLFDERQLIDGLLTLGQVMLYLSPLLAGFYIARQYRSARAIGQGAGKSQGAALLGAVIAGIVAAVMVFLLALFIDNVENIWNFRVREHASQCFA